MQCYDHLSNIAIPYYFNLKLVLIQLTHLCVL